ncbi:MAG: exodeoxyribonuclease V subunit gamma [Desulfobacterales bacterium]|nr:exodeoxyribonuclease V subunit gamma [Desulfobacterales bacterium]
MRACQHPLGRGRPRPSRRWGFPAQAHNTWKAGIERLLLGYAMPSRGTEVFHGILAVDAMEGGDARAARAISGLPGPKPSSWPATLDRRQPLEAWRSLLNSGPERLFPIG